MFGLLPMGGAIFKTFLEGDGGDGGGGDGGGGPTDEAIAAARDAATAAGTHLVSDWREALPEDIRGDASLADIKDLNGLAKSMIHAQKLVGSDKILKPNENWTDVEWNEYYSAVGRPEDASGYELAGPENPPEGYTVNQEFEAEFRKEAHANGLTTQQAAKMWSSIQERTAASFGEMLTGEQTRLRTETEGLQKEWGQAYKDKMKAAQGAAGLIEKAVPGFNEWLKVSGAGREPMIHKVLAVIAENAGEERLGEGGGRTSMTPAEAESKANSIRGDKSNPKYAAYWEKNHPNHVAVVQEVMELEKITP